MFYFCMIYLLMEYINVLAFFKLNLVLNFIFLTDEDLYLTIQGFVNSLQNCTFSIILLFMFL